MVLTSLSLVVSSEATDTSALRAAAAIAWREDAHLDVTCLGLEPMPLDPIAIGAAPIALQESHDEALRRAQSLAGWVRSALPAEVRATIVPMTAPSFGLVGVVTQAARFSDLVVTARPYGSNHAPLAPVIVEALLFGTGAPLLVVPDADRTDWRRTFRHLCLAWNDSDEALRAARAALPFLRRASKVQVAVVGRPTHGTDDPSSLTALLRWLGRHGVEAEGVALDRTDRRNADVLAHFALNRGCEALVMGAYGHSRLREMLLGGTTRDMLAEVPLPLIMAH